MSFNHFILDKQDPIFEFCPENHTNTTEPGKPTCMVEWEHPIATDNSGDNPTVTCDRTSGTNFPIGQTLVRCTAFDAYGNSNENCHFYIHIMGE